MGSVQYEERGRGDGDGEGEMGKGRREDGEGRREDGEGRRVGRGSRLLAKRCLSLLFLVAISLVAVVEAIFRGGSGSDTSNGANGSGRQSVEVERYIDNDSVIQL